MQTPRPLIYTGWARVTVHPHNMQQKSISVNITQRLLFAPNVPQWSRRGNGRQRSVCYDQQFETTEERLEGEDVSPRLAWISCRLPICVGVVTHVLCWAHSQALYAAQSFFSVMNVRATEIWCSGRRRIPILRSGWSKLQRMWRYGGRGGGDIRLPDWTLFSVNPWKRHLIRQYRTHGLNLSLESEESHDGAHVHFALPMRDVLNYLFPGRCFGRGWPTSLAPLTWPPRGPDLPTPDNSLWGSINRRVSVPRCNTNEECHRAADGVFRTNAPTHVTEDVEAHPLLCPASACTYGSTGRATKK
jgi:hypothetical protein